MQQVVRVRGVGTAFLREAAPRLQVFWPTLREATTVDLF